MEKSKRWFQKSWLIIVLSIMFLVIIPMLMMFVFKNQKVQDLIYPLVAGEVFTFYGALLAAVGTVFAVWMTINATRKNQIDVLRVEFERNRINKWIEDVKTIFKSSIDIFNFTNSGFYQENTDIIKEDELFKFQENYFEALIEIRNNIEIKYWTLVFEMNLTFRSSPFLNEENFNIIKDEIFSVTNVTYQKYTKIMDEKIQILRNWNKYVDEISTNPNSHDINSYTQKRKDLKMNYDNIEENIRLYYCSYTELIIALAKQIKNLEKNASEEIIQIMNNN